MLRLAVKVLRDEAAKRGHDTQEEIAEHAGINRSALSRTMAGHTVPSLLTVYRLAKAYGITIDELVLDTEHGLIREAGKATA